MKQVFFNASLYTGMDEPYDRAEAFVVENNVFTAVGTNREILDAHADGNAPVDLKKRFVCAGFNDSHMHLLNLGYYCNMAMLDGHTGSLTELIAYLKDYLAAHPVNPGQWLRGRGWNQDYFSDTNRLPDRYDLDRVSGDIPIAITRVCGHCCVVNSKALALAGITADTRAPEGGAIGFYTEESVSGNRHVKEGEPDGRFYDNAIDLVMSFVPLPDADEVAEYLSSGMKVLNSCGITSCQTDDYSSVSGLSHAVVNDAYRLLKESGRFTVRVYEQSNFSNPDDLRAFIGEGNVTGAGDDLFRFGPLKLLGDGSLGGRTAFLSVPYADDKSTKGFPVFSKERLAEMIACAHAGGMQIAVHAIGDACLDMVLDAYESVMHAEAGADSRRKKTINPGRHGIVHCQIFRKDQLHRMAKLGLHVYIQSIFLDYDNHIVEARVGPGLASTSYRWKSLIENDITVSNGSDAPVEMPDVMKGIECAVTRTSMDGTGPYHPEEAFSVREAIDSFTVSGAFASFEEDRKGRIAPGYLADFVILGADPFTVSPHNLHTIPVLATFLGGREVYRSETYERETK